MIRIICVGKIKEKFFNDAILEYKKRLNKYTKLEIIVVNDYNYDKIKTIRVENDNILKLLNDSDYNIALTPDGNMLDSYQLSLKINNILTNHSTITFVIGGSYGLNKLVKEKCNYCLSFSYLTFPHQLFRVILLEQIYRSFKIINNEEYHK